MTPTRQELIAGYVLFLSRQPTIEELACAEASCRDWRDFFALLAQTSEFSDRHPVWTRIMDDVRPFSVTQVPLSSLRQVARDKARQAVAVASAGRLHRVAEGLRPLDQSLSTLSADFRSLLARSP